jgi:nicotinamide-nucleotide amidase
VADPPGRAASEDLLSTEPEDLGRLAERLQTLALDAGATVATAESCTGGLVGHVITGVPGSSGYYLGGIVSYADRVKAGLLGVPQEALHRHGAVSAQVARAMAEGVRSSVGADIAVAVTGVAGPDGGSDAKPVGLTYVAVAGPECCEVQRYHWQGDRGANKAQSAGAALRMLIDALERRAAGLPPPAGRAPEADPGHAP